MLCDDTILRHVVLICITFSDFMVLINQRSAFVILPILNHVKRLKPLVLYRPGLPVSGRPMTTKGRVIRSVT